MKFDVNSSLQWLSKGTLGRGSSYNLAAGNKYLFEPSGCAVLTLDAATANPMFLFNINKKASFVVNEAKPNHSEDRGCSRRRDLVFSLNPAKKIQEHLLMNDESQSWEIFFATAVHHHKRRHLLKFDKDGGDSEGRSLGASSSIWDGI